MKRLTLIILFLLTACLLLCACGEETVELIMSATPTPTVELDGVVIDPAASAIPTAKADYNSLGDADENDTETIRAQLLQVAEACQEIYAQADKGTARNVVLSGSVVRDMVIKIGQIGYSAIDVDETIDMQCPELMVSFGESIITGVNTAVTYYTVYNDGQITAYHLSRTDGEWFLISMSATWDKDSKPKSTSEGRYSVGDVSYTDKGWLIFSRDTDTFDENQKSNTLNYVFVRVMPYDSTKLSLCQRYVEPIGYFENNLFTTSWSETNLIPIDFNSLYSQLFGMYNGTEKLSARNELNYYSPLQNTDIYIIPTSTFEKTVQYYFNIDDVTLRAISDYSSAAGGYMFLGYRDGYYNVTPRTPTPEVVDYWYNGDGTVTMRVDAVNKWYGTDKAFTHDLTVRINDDGSFQYVSNVFYAADTNIIPEQRLAYLLDVERTKTNY